MSAEGLQSEGWRRTSPLGVLARTLSYLRSAALPLLAAGYSMRDNWSGAGALLTAAAVVLCVLLGLAWIDWRYRRYSIGADDIRAERGLLSRHARSVPYERIQDVSLEEALVPRLLGLVEVRFETGAGGKDEVSLSYVSREQGEALRETVKARRGGGMQGCVDPGQQPEEATTLFAMGQRRLLIFGLFEFSLVVFAILAGLAQQFDFLLPFDPWDAGRWRDVLAGQGHRLAELGLAARLMGGLLAVMALALVGLITGIVRTVLRDWGFRLDRTSRGLRRRRGLLTRTDVVMPLHRVQALTIGTGLIRRHFGWHSLSIVSLAQDKGSASHVAVPLGRIDEIAHVAHVAGFAMPDADTEWRRSSVWYRIHAAVIGALLTWTVAAILIIAASATPHSLPSIRFFAFVFIAFGIILALRQTALWHHERHALDGGQLYVRQGWLAPKLQIASRWKLHSVEIVQGPLARRGGYAHLRLGLAGGDLAIRGMSVEDAAVMRDHLLSAMTAVDFSRLASDEGAGIGPTPHVSQYMKP